MYEEPAWINAASRDAVIAVRRLQGAERWFDPRWSHHAVGALRLTCADANLWSHSAGEWMRAGLARVLEAASCDGRVTVSADLRTTSGAGDRLLVSLLVGVLGSDPVIETRDLLDLAIACLSGGGMTFAPTDPRPLLTRGDLRFTTRVSRRVASLDAGGSHPIEISVPWGAEGRDWLPVCDLLLAREAMTAVRCCLRGVQVDRESRAELAELRSDVTGLSQIIGDPRIDRAVRTLDQTSARLDAGAFAYEFVVTSEEPMSEVFQRAVAGELSDAAVGGHRLGAGRTQAMLAEPRLAGGFELEPIGLGACDAITLCLPTRVASADYLSLLPLSEALEALPVPSPGRRPIPTIPAREAAPGCVGEPDGAGDPLEEEATGGCSLDETPLRTLKTRALSEDEMVEVREVLEERLGLILGEMVSEILEPASLGEYEGISDEDAARAWLRVNVLDLPTLGSAAFAILQNELREYLGPDRAEFALELLPELPAEWALEKSVPAPWAS